MKYLKDLKEKELVEYVLGHVLFTEDKCYIKEAHCGWNRTGYCLLFDEDIKNNIRCKECIDIIGYWYFK